MMIPSPWRTETECSHIVFLREIQCFHSLNVKVPDFVFAWGQEPQWEKTKFVWFLDPSFNLFGWMYHKNRKYSWFSLSNALCSGLLAGAFCLMLFKRRSETAYDPSPPSYAVEWVKAVKGRSARMMPFAKKRTATTARRQRWRRARRKLCARAITMEFGPVSKSNGVWYNSCADKEQGHIQQIHQRRGGRPWRRRCSGLVVLLPPW